MANHRSTANASSLSCSSGDSSASVEFVSPRWTVVALAAGRPSIAKACPEFLLRRHTAT